MPRAAIRPKIMGAHATLGSEAAPIKNTPPKKPKTATNRIIAENAMPRGATNTAFPGSLFCSESAALHASNPCVEVQSTKERARERGVSRKVMTVSVDHDFATGLRP